MRMPSNNLISVVLVIITFISSGTAQTPVAYVLEIQGDWHLNGNRSSVLRRWQKLPPRGTITIETPTPQARIVIARLNGEIFTGRKCKDEDCSQPIKLPQGNPQRSVLGVAFEGTAELLFGFSPFYSYSIHRTRTFGEALSDGVVKLDKGKIDFNPVLRQAGRYYVRWRSRPRFARSVKWTRPVSLRAEQGQPSLVEVSDFKPGLYEINLQRAVGDSYETFASGWVLVSTSAKYESMAASFRQAVDLTRQWGTMVEPDTSRQFLRAHLDYLAAQAGK